MMRQFLRTVDSAIAMAEAAEPTLTDLEYAFMIALDRVGAAQDHLAAVTLELDGIEGAIAAASQVGSGGMKRTFVTSNGDTIDVSRPDFSLCGTSEELEELKYVLSEQIISIELQIDMHATLSAEARASYDPSWLPRTKAALRWAKLYRDEAQARQGRLASLEAAKTNLQNDGSNMLTLLAAALKPEDFTALRSIATALAKVRLRVEAGP